MTHTALLQHYESEYVKAGGDIALNAEVVDIEKYRGIPAYRVTIDEVDLSGVERVVKSSMRLQARCIINCAGLGSGRVSALAGIGMSL